MIEPTTPKFQWGQPVRAVADLYNDGSYPDAAAEEVLVREGDPGEIIQVGTHVETNTFIYMVEFHKERVVGCLEDEIAAVF